LISAAKSVAASTNNLCEAANDTVKGNTANTDSIVAAANGVAMNTAHLVAAARAKSDPNSKTQVRLKDAAKAVKNATKSLVDSAEEVDKARQEHQSTSAMFNADLTTVERLKAEQAAREKVLRLERELRAAQQGINDMNKDRYGGEAEKPAAAGGAAKTAKPAPKPAEKPAADKPAAAEKPAASPKPAGGRGAGAPAKSPAAAPAAGGGTPGKYTLAELKAGPPDDCDKANLENYLSDAEFESVLTMNRGAWAGAPKWKRDKLKKENGLF